MVTAGHMPLTPQLPPEARTDEPASLYGIWSCSSLPPPRNDRWFRALAVERVRGRDVGEFRAVEFNALPQELTGIDHDQLKLLLVREGDEIRSFQGTCPHAKAPLAGGVLCGGRIICPWHAGAFDSRTGALLEPVPLTGLQSHPVRVADGFVIIDTDPVAADQPTPGSDQRVFILVGAGAASASAATTLRAEGFSGRISMVGPDPGEPLDRTQLSKMALAQEDFDRGTLPLLETGFAETLKLERMVERATAVDPGAHRITLSTGEILDYDAALLATGTRPRRWPLRVVICRMSGPSGISAMWMLYSVTSHPAGRRS